MANRIQGSSTEQPERDQLESVQGRIGFARRTLDEKAHERVEPTRGYDLPMVDYDVTIRNARPIADKLSLDKEGFRLIQHKMPCANERDPAIMRKKYTDEMVLLIQDYFKASRVMPVDLGGFTIRSLTGNRSEVADKRLVRSFGAGFAHVDYAPVTGPMIAARDNQLQGNEIRPYSRMMIIQTWRPLSPPPQDLPLAFCDASSILDTDLVDTYYTAYGVRCKARMLHYSPSHRWYYLPDWTSDEFMLFKGYDSETHYKAWSAHSAFDNRRAYPNAQPRESVESRYYVYYD